MNQKLAYLVFAFALLVALIVLLRGKDESTPSPEVFRSRIQQSFFSPEDRSHSQPVRSPASGGSSSPSENRSPDPSPTDLPQQGSLDREEFLRFYGEDLELIFDRGRLVRIDGVRPGKALGSRSGDPQFNPRDPQKLLERSQQILAHAREMLGAGVDTQFLPAPQTTPGESSAQVIFQQSWEGIPFSPGGTVTLLLGSEGELLTLDSSLYPSFAIVNHRKIARPSAGRDILWVSEKEPKAILLHAYETFERGIQTVVDASSGATLFQRDRRKR